MFEVHTSSGMLRNTDSGNPMLAIGQCPSLPATLCTSLCLSALTAELILLGRVWCWEFRVQGVCIGSIG